MVITRHRRHQKKKKKTKLRHCLQFDSFCVFYVVQSTEGLPASLQDVLKNVYHTERNGNLITLGLK